MYDLLLKKGLVIDSTQGIHGIVDVAISSDKIALISQNIPSSQAKRVINTSGKIITPGLIDDHVHCYRNMLEIGVSPDRAGVNSGVTTIVSAGCAGPATLSGFRKFITKPAKTNVYCLLNVALAGMVYMAEPGQRLDQKWCEISNWNDFDSKFTLKRVEENRDIVVGIKIRAFGPLVENEGAKPIEFAKKIAKDAGLPLVVHIGAMQGHVSHETALDILELLEKGDILCHIYTAKSGRVIEPGKTISKKLRDAKERGVLFDMSHGWFNFDFETARYGVAEGFIPDIISSDLGIPNVFGPVYSLCETMSKMMALGLRLDQVVEMTTATPAKALGFENRHGSLKVGREADISVLELLEARHTFTDSHGATLDGDLLLIPVFVIKSGKGIA